MDENPQYITCTLEVAEFTPEHGLLIWKQVSEDDNNYYLEATKGTEVLKRIYPKLKFDPKDYHTG